MDGLIKYNHAGIDTASMEIATSSKTMNGQLDDLRPRCGTSRAAGRAQAPLPTWHRRLSGTLLRRTSTWYLPRSARRFRRAIRTCPRPTPRWGTPSAAESHRTPAPYGPRAVGFRSASTAF